MDRAKAKGGKAAKTAPKKAVKAKRPAAAPVRRMTAKELRQERFVTEYLVDYNGKRAAIAAGFSPGTARQIANQMLDLNEVQAAIQSRQAKLAEKLEDMEVFVLGQLMGVATADPRELSEHFRVACRYCWGKGFKYQRRASERAEAYEAWLADERAKQEKSPPEPPSKFDEMGGIGYTRNRDPNPECPECDGHGDSFVLLKDTRDLSEHGKQLYAGVEETQHGLKLRTNSKMDATLNIGKHFGMFAQKLKVGADKDDPATVGFVVIPAKDAGDGG